MGNVLEVKNLIIQYPVKSGFGKKKKILTAVNEVSFRLGENSTLGIVGESGSGKTTVLMSIMRLAPVTYGDILYNGKSVLTMTFAERQAYKRDVQIIFQDPMASLNPRMTVGEIIEEPLLVHFPSMSKRERRQKVSRMMEKVGLSQEMIRRYPHEFSGGQAQRIDIARAIITKPKFLLCDEPTSALDLSIQAQIINLLLTLRKDTGLSLLFVSHNLSVVSYLSDRLIVMYLGKVMEVGNTEIIYTHPAHPYTKGLMGSMLSITKEYNEEDKISGEIPSPINLPKGCFFQSRCAWVQDICINKYPKAVNLGDNHVVYCHFLRDFYAKRKKDIEKVKEGENI